MLTLTCIVTAKYRDAGGRRYVLEPVAHHAIVYGVPEPQGLDLDRTHIAVYERGAGKGILELNDIKSSNHGEGGCLIVLGSLGWCHLNVLLDEADTNSVVPDLDAALKGDNLLISLSLNGGFSHSDHVAIEGWLAGDRYPRDSRFYGELMPAFGLVRRK